MITNNDQLNFWIPPEPLNVSKIQLVIVSVGYHHWCCLEHGFNLDSKHWFHSDEIVNLHNVTSWSAEGLEINVSDCFSRRSPAVLELIKLKKSYVMLIRRFFYHSPPLLVISGKKFSREFSSQSVSLLNHLKQGCYHGTVSCNVSSIECALIAKLCTVCQTRFITKTKQLIRRISWILWRSPLFQLLFLATHLTKESSFDWFKSHSPLFKSQ